MDPTDEQIARLPKRAQSKLSSQEREIDRLRARFAGGPADSATFADDFLARQYP